MRYAAFLRGVMPTNAKMPEIRRAFEKAGFAHVVTVLGSGNVVFDARTASVQSLENRAEAAMAKHLGSAFMTFVRPVTDLVRMLEADPYRGARLDPRAKRVVTFVRSPPAPKLELPIERDGARILRMEDGVVLSAYLPTPKGPVFMALLQKAFGKEQTTRTWQTLEKVVSR
jgi:uncharacterized protein (DUF1697 family)